jgi:fructosamine-3-kinase
MGTARPGAWESMGQQLARMHRCTSDKHGWPHDNWIGSMPQINTAVPDWIEFYTKSRLQPQVEWARQKHLSLKDVDHLIKALPELYNQYNPAPSLLHGDLWAGNAGFLSDGTPAVFDPASYHGDREADLAMTEMFGGYPREFYKGYNAEWPLDPGYQTRKHLHLLYHTLNHYNLFGGGYGTQAQSVIRQLITSLSGN